MGSLMTSFVTYGFATSGAFISGMYCPTSPDVYGGSISLTSIPPERLGLQGEYDHNGLAKRVVNGCSKSLGLAAIEKLQVKQRGSVVIRSGCVSNEALLEKIVHLAMAEEGATNVELRGVKVCAGAQ